MTPSSNDSVAIQGSEVGPYAWLLLAQLFFIAITPLVSNTGLGWSFLNAGLFAIILAGIYAARQTRGALVVSIIFFLPAVAAWLGPDLLSEHLDMLLRLTTAAICFGVTSAVVLRSISQHQRVTRETILGGINVYLLLSFAFMMLHGTIMQMYPGAYVLGGQSLHEYLDGTEDSHGFATLLYFSFTTMTTLGYGDIVPVDARARLLTSTQAVVGQLYVAIFIARLVSLEVSQRIRKS